jgi:hypothetical protein
MMSQPDNFNEERYFGEFRRKVKAAEVLSASMERLWLSLRFTGKVSVVMQNGRVLKSGYEEGYFRQRDSAGVDDEITQNRSKRKEVNSEDRDLDFESPHFWQHRPEVGHPVMIGIQENQIADGRSS